MLSTLRKRGATGVCVVVILSSLSTLAGAEGAIQAQFSLLGSHSTHGPPALSVRANSGIDLTWASGVPGPKLQSSDTLVSGGSWREVQATVEESEGKSHVHLAPSDRDLYFRLSTP